MNTLTTQQEAQIINRFKRFVNAYEMAKELFPELEHKQWMTLADCIDEAVFNND